jgi:hypothetical protein
MAQSVLSKIKPEYLGLVAYSKPGDPSLEVVDAQELNESAYPPDTPTRSVDMEHNTEWAKELRKAAEKPM